MPIPNRSLVSGTLILAGLVLLLSSGCITAPVSTNLLAQSMAYEPERSKTQIDATVGLRLNYVLSPEVVAQWKRLPLIDDQTIENYRNAVGNTIVADIEKSGLFTRVEPNSPAPDFIVLIWGEERLSPQPMLVVTMQVQDSTKEVISTRRREAQTGATFKDSNVKSVLPSVMAALKTDMITDLLACFARRQEQAAQAQAAAFAKTALPDLLASADPTVAVARERNRAIIAVGNQQLPTMLRDKKTDELSALVVKIEQTVLDLNHESEVAKDHAQQVAAANGDQRQLDELRGLAICYRERIELLKPIAAALKEEIANRNR
jgi:hypothetical protein